MTGRKKETMYRMSFQKPGCNYSRCFTTEKERDKFAQDMKNAGYKVTTWDDMNLKSFKIIE